MPSDLKTNGYYYQESLTQLRDDLLTTLESLDESP